MSALPLEIRLFANSGHHYYFAPLPEPVLKQAPELAASCQKEDKSWLVWPDENKQWVRYRLGAKDATPGLWLAIESNLGTKARGFTWEPRKDGLHQPLPPNFDRNKTPYAATATNFLPQVAQDLRWSEVLSGFGDSLTGSDDMLATITWKVPIATPRHLDLVIDFGNTRTVALLLEQQPAGTGLANVTHALRFLPRGTNFEPNKGGHAAHDPYVIVDSWLLLHEPMFAGLEPPKSEEMVVAAPETQKRAPTLWEDIFRTTPIEEIVAETKYIPQMFVELSPALLGGGAGRQGACAILRELNLQQGGNYFLSSPKRYAWDNDKVGEGDTRPLWNMALNPWNPPLGVTAMKGLPLLQGQILRFMFPDGRTWPFEAPPIALPADKAPLANTRPTHPRSSALTWMALSILEKAYAQINSQWFSGDPYGPRCLRSVLVTFPAGWTSGQLESYRAKWQEAINIFTLAHLEPGSKPPQLVTDLDEAVASQLPFIYSEVLRMPGGESWIELVGKGQGNNAHVRAMNIDVGGGTTDVAVVDYQDLLPGAPVHLNATVLFKNSSTVAGDALVKRIIETVLLPKLGERFAPQTPERNRFQQLFANPAMAFIQKHRPWPARLARIVRLVFVPIVNQWLKESGEGRYGNPNQPGRGYPPAKICADDGSMTVDEALVEELNTLAREYVGLPVEFKLLDWEKTLDYDQALLERCIEKEFQPLFRSLASLVAAFECDLVFVSGKPSELPQVLRLLQRELPILPQRIIPAKNFPAGGWYPLPDGSGRIRDAKTATVVGAVLYRAITNSMITGWMLTSKPDTAFFSENFWGDCTQPRMFDQTIFLPPGEMVVTVDLLTGAPIGRKRFLARDLLPDQVYKLRWKPDLTREMAKLSVTLRRVKQDGLSEALELVEVKDAAGKPVALEEVELQVCSLPDEGFWLDAPSLVVQW
jgi:hypothetical protein